MPLSLPKDGARASSELLPLRAGYVTLRVPWRHAEDEPEAVIEAIRIRLGQSDPVE